MMYWLGLMAILLVAYVLIVLEDKFNDDKR